MDLFRNHELMVDQGVPYEEALGNPNVLVFEFPQASPDSAICTPDMLGMKQLHLWKAYQDYWCEHKPSMTCFYRDDDFLEMGDWVWNNFDNISGISFLPYDDHKYKQAPYEEISEEEYKERVDNWPSVDWTLLSEYEKEDQTEGTKELACTAAGGCEL